MTDLVAVVQLLTLLQIDPTAAIAPSADLVAWSRLGSAYRRDDLKRPVEADISLFELARANARAMPMEPVHVGDAGEPAVVNGVKREWRVDPSLLEDRFAGRTALLSPFHRLVHDRVRTELARAGCDRVGLVAFAAMALLDRLRAWWNKDAVERADEEARMTTAERDVAEEDFEARKDDIAAQTYLGGGAADYERDSEPPPDETGPGQ